MAREIDSRTEHGEQVAVIEWAKWNVQRWPELNLLFAIPNGGLRAKRTAVILMQEGVKPGVSDFLLPVPKYSAVTNSIHHGLWIEMKVTKGGRLSILQLEWLTEMHKQGYATCVAPGEVRATAYLANYLNNVWNEPVSFDLIQKFSVEKKRL